MKAVIGKNERINVLEITRKVDMVKSTIFGWLTMDLSIKLGMPVNMMSFTLIEPMDRISWYDALLSKMIWLRQK